MQNIGLGSIGPRELWNLQVHHEHVTGYAHKYVRKLTSKYRILT